jgi:pyridoxal phosphate enzyme (YggS family)
MEMLQRISDIYRRMTHASMRAGREPGAARLVAVSKTVDAKAVYEAYDDGLRDFGENRLQEAQRKAEELGGLNITWHMVGHLQSNKAKAAVELFDLIHSVDSLKLMRLIDRYAAESGKVQRVLLQVKLSEEESKAGTDEAGLQEMMDQAASTEHVRVEGLMTVPPFYDDPERVRPFFRRLREMAERFGLSELSMGMTGDFEAAIEEGATMVRIGTAIFGERDYA